MKFINSSVTKLFASSIARYAVLKKYEDGSLRVIALFQHISNANNFVESSLEKEDLVIRFID